MRGSRFWTDEEPYSPSTAELIAMGQINPSPLAVSSERAPGRRHPECDRCPLQADCREAAWSALYRTVSRPFPRPGSGKIAVKVINHYGDEVLKVYDVASH